MLWREECVHNRGSGGGDAAVNGADASPHIADAYGHPVAHHVPSSSWFRHEHLGPAHPQTSKWASLNRLCYSMSQLYCDLINICN